MRLLLDNNVSVRVGHLLEVRGWDVTHVRSLGLHSAPDRVVLDAARQDDRALVSADTDFGALLAATHAGILIANLMPIADELRQGSIIVIGEDSVRIRRLPIG